MRLATRWIGAGLFLAVAGYGALVSATWLKFGRRPVAAPGDAHGALDACMPEYDVAERHQIRVAAPSEVTFASALDLDLQGSPIVRGIIRTRELVLGAEPDTRMRPAGLLAEMTALGWGVLEHRPGELMVLGAVTQPWQAAVVFRALPPDAFAAFADPGYVKIAWTLQVRPLGDDACVFLAETRAIATDATARRLFRWYWARFSPGIVVIRWATLRMTKADAERRVRASGPEAVRLDDRLLEEARRIGGHRTKKDTVTEALEDYIQRRRQAQVLDLFGTVAFDPTYDHRKARTRS